MLWNGLKKAINRAGTQVMIKTGQVEQSVDAEFDAEERRFHAMEDMSTKLHKELKHYLDLLRLMTNSQHLVAQTLDLFFESPLAPVTSETPVRERDGILKRYLQATEQLNRKVLEDLDGPYRDSVLNPVARFNSYFSEIKDAILKRNHKRLDYDHLRAKVKRLTEKPSEDAEKLPQLEREMQLAQQQYNHINVQLKTELPQLAALRVPYLDPLFESFVQLQLRFFTDSYQALDTLQQDMDAQTRQDYADDALGLRVEDVLHKMRELNITAMTE